MQDSRIRRLSPLECERMMGFPDEYTKINGASKTNRYQAIGNSWAVPVVRWIGGRVIKNKGEDIFIGQYKKQVKDRYTKINSRAYFYDFGKGIITINENMSINCTAVPENCSYRSLLEIVSSKVPESIYISPVGCHGIIRRKEERSLSINNRLEQILVEISSQMDFSEIEKKSRVQKRGKYSKI